MLKFRAQLSAYAGTVALASALAASLALNVYLARRVRIFTMPRAAANSVRAGTRLQSPLLVLDPNGKEIRVTLDASRPTVLYVFSPSCPWCKMNEPNIKSLVAQAGSGFQFIGLSTTSKGLKDYIGQGHAPFPVYSVQSQEQAAKLGLNVTPETIVVDAGSVVRMVWLGAYLKDNLPQVEKFFHARLPGIKGTASTVP